MLYRLEMREEHVYVEAGGPFDPEVGRRLIGDILEACGARGLNRVLVDARALDPLAGIAERFELGRTLAESGAGAVRIAVLVDPCQLFSKTLEDSARNRGVAVRSTAIEAEAYGFLGLAPPG